jgi:glutamine phosphoribosylpyrophosphate amidotransferase
MCSIIGFQGVYETDLITRLCYNSRIRGLHSFGFSFYQNGKLQVKKYLNYDKFLTDLNKHKPNKFIAHFRYSTSGDYKKIENNQPLIYEDQSIIFNGVISQKSKDEMQEEFQLKLTAENDGFVLVQKYDDLEFIKNRNISFAMIALSDNKLIALRNNNIILMDESKKYKDQEQRIANTIEHANEACRQLEECRSANEALIKHATPQSVVKAIKNTPLPKRG